MLEEAAVEKVPYPHFVGCDVGLVVWWVRGVIRVVLGKCAELSCMVMKCEYKLELNKVIVFRNSVVED